MTNEEMFTIAYQQSSIDCNAKPEDFTLDHYVIHDSVPNEHARKYLNLPQDLDLISYGQNIVASVNPANLALKEATEAYLKSHTQNPAYAFTLPDIIDLNRLIQPLGFQVYYQSEFFIPDLKRLEPLSCDYDIRLIEKDSLDTFYLPEWENALTQKRKHLNELALGAYDHDQLIGLAGATKDCESMWQIGIDILPAYRRQGIAAALTSQIAIHLLEKGIVPFYSVVWSNISSVKNALKAGLQPAWIELTAKPMK